MKATNILVRIFTLLLLAAHSPAAAQVFEETNSEGSLTVQKNQITSMFINHRGSPEGTPTISFQFEGENLTYFYYLPGYSPSDASAVYNDIRSCELISLNWEEYGVNKLITNLQVKTKSPRRRRPRGN